MRFRYKGAIFAVTTAALSVAMAAFAQSAPEGKIGKTIRASIEAPRTAPVRAKDGAPDVIWILLDDVGFGATSAFGGLAPTPNFDALADAGLRYTNFHTTGICSPTRAALLTGRNHNKVGMGLFPHDVLSANFPGYTGRLEPKDGTIAEYLRAAGYSTYALGKWHLTPDAELTDLGPFDRWPLGKGFDHYFGFLGGGEDQYKPNLVEDNNSVRSDGRHLNAQLIDKAILYIDRQEKLAPDKPYFMYLAPGAGHSPHQVDQVWLDKFKGKYDGGWDDLRRQIFDRQKRLGLIPANAKLPDRDARIPAWSSLNEDQKRVYARFMEGYAAFLAYTDWEIGRLIAHLREREQLSNTAIFLIIGDNGASKEGGPHGSLRPEFSGPVKPDKEQLAELVTRIDDIGTARSYSNFPMGWAQTINTPFRKWKSDASTEGGTRNPMIVHWPKGLKKSGIRAQFGHVIDLLPTTLEITGAQAPAELRGIKQTSIQGTSLAYSFKNAKAATRHSEQYFALLGNGALVKDGWKASFSYRPDFVDLFATYPAPDNPPNNGDKRVWELYNLNSDFNERINLAAKHPAKLKELQAAFERQAEDNNVYPFFNWTDAFDRVRTSATKNGINIPGPDRTAYESSSKTK